MSKNIFRVELSSENPIGRDYFYASLDLPASEQQIKDAWQRARFWNNSELYHDVSILKSPYLPNLEVIRLDSTTVDELNYLAKRLDELPDEEFTVYQALFQKRYAEWEESDLLPVKDLINMTYGLDHVSTASNVDSDEALGQLIIENDPRYDDAAYSPNKRRIGEQQRQKDGGVYIGRTYVVTNDYELPKIYDGTHLPETESDENTVFRLKIAGMNEPEESAEWISLPIDDEEAARIARNHSENFIENCVYYSFESAVPHISPEVFDDMFDFGTLNTIAERYLGMSYSEQLKFKAILEAEDIQDIDEVSAAADRLNEYEIEHFVQDEDSFFKEYLAHHLDTKFDVRWLNRISADSEGSQILKKLGAKLTDYGVLSARGGSIYGIVPYREQCVEESLSNESMEVIEILGQTALFTNGRVKQNELPDGLYKYDLREGDSGSFVSVEPSVIVNHAGTIITKEPIVFGDEGYIGFDDDSSPNFLGDTMTVSEFQNADFTQSEDELPHMGGI